MTKRKSSGKATGDSRDTSVGVYIFSPQPDKFGCYITSNPYDYIAPLLWPRVRDDARAVRIDEYIYITGGGRKYDRAIYHIPSREWSRGSDMIHSRVSVMCRYH
jgi:hypothetical protein